MPRTVGKWVAQTSMRLQPRIVTYRVPLGYDGDTYYSAPATTYYRSAPLPPAPAIPPAPPASKTNVNRTPTNGGRPASPAAPEKKTEGTTPADQKPTVPPPEEKKTNGTPPAADAAKPAEGTPKPAEGEKKEPIRAIPGADADESCRRPEARGSRQFGENGQRRPPRLIGK